MLIVCFQLHTSKVFNSSDVFNTSELVSVMSQPNHITGKLINGDLIYNWQEKISTKYSKLPGIHDLHDFVVVTSPNTGNATMLYVKGAMVGCLKSHI